LHQKESEHDRSERALPPREIRAQRAAFTGLQRTVESQQALIQELRVAKNAATVAQFKQAVVQQLQSDLARPPR
jgi:hypothetical protein